MVGDELGELRRRLEAAEADLEEMRRERPGQRGPRPSARGVVIGLGLAVLLAPVGVAATGEVLREGVRNGTTAKETEIIGKFNATTGAKGGYVTRQSNTQTGPNAGGGAIYGCRGAAGGTAAGSAPCLRASNLADGFAFELASKSGPVGLFEVASASDAPFATNGGGLVTNLNADKVDGLDAAQLRGEQGPPGPKGDTGPPGPQGDTGTIDTSDFYNKAASDERFLATTAKAADADKLDGEDSAAYEDVLDSGTATDTYGDIAPGQCIFNARRTTAPVGNITVVSPTAMLPAELVWTGIATSTETDGAETFTIAVWKVCNVSTSTIPNRSLTNRWAVLGP